MNEARRFRPLRQGAAPIAHRVACAGFQDRGRPGDRTRTVAADLWLRNDATGTATPIKVTVRWTGFGAACWLNVHANPTSLLTGSNALAAALGPRRRESLRLLRLPFLVLERVLRAVDPGFAFG